MVKFPFYARLALTLFAIALILLFMWIGKSLLVPLFFSFLVAILLHPLVKFFEKKRFPRALAAVVGPPYIYGTARRIILFFQSPGGTSFAGSSFPSGQSDGQMGGDTGLDQR